MGSSFKIGRVFGIDLKVHWTFFLLLAFFAFAGYQESGSLANALITALIILALFICVVLHEYGHSAEARRRLRSLGVDLDVTTTVKGLSAANRQTVAIARALVGEARAVVMDEPTASLTERE